MKATLAWLIGTFVVLGGFGSALAVDLKDKVKLEIESVGLHPGMEPGMYVCASNHLHIKGTVQNLTGVPLGHVKVAGKAFGTDGKLLGTATFATKQATLAPGEKAEINVEFLTVTGPLIQQVKRHDSRSSRRRRSRDIAPSACGWPGQSQLPIQRLEQKQPPSELLCSWSNAATTGFAKGSPWNES